MLCFCTTSNLRGPLTGAERSSRVYHRWACVRRRQHCFRNLDVDYLTIKAFLLERFLHDALYEAPTAEVFNGFLDIRPAPAAQVSFASSPSLPRSAVSGSLS